MIILCEIYFSFFHTLSLSHTLPARQECGEAQREWVAAIHGQAAIADIKQEYLSAIKKYLRVLRVAGVDIGEKREAEEMGEKGKQEEEEEEAEEMCREIGTPVDGLQLVHACVFD